MFPRVYLLQTLEKKNKQNRKLHKKLLIWYCMDNANFLHTCVQVKVIFRS